MSLERFIKFIKEGEPVSAGTPNRPLRQLDQNIQYLWDVIDASNMGSTVYAREVLVESTVEVGMPVYWDAAESRFDKAIAKMDNDPVTGGIKNSELAGVWGIVSKKHEANNADILLFGYAEIDISAATDSEGLVPAGLYYLSGTNAGKLITQSSAVSIPVLRADGVGHVYVNPTFMDFLDNHRHYKFDLTMLPAGDTAPPFIGAWTGVNPLTGEWRDASSYSYDNPPIHKITNSNSDLSGWLPADDAVFDGKAPAGAKFGYNIGVEPGLENLFPPIPLDNVDVELLRPSIYPAAGTVFKHINSHASATIAAFTPYTSRHPIQYKFEHGDSIILTPLNLAAAAGTTGLIFSASYDMTKVAGEWSSISITANNITDASIQVGSAGADFQVTIFKQPTAWKKIQLAGQALDDLVKIDRNGIWWMSNCYDQVPWPTDYDSNSSVSESYDDCPHQSVPEMRLYFTKVNFATDPSVVRSLTSVDSRIKIYCAGSNLSDSVGDLDIDLDLSFAITEDETGYNVLKSLDGEVFARGPVAEGVFTTTPSNIILKGSINKTVTIDSTERTVHYGNICVDAAPVNLQELPAQLVRLNGVTEEHTPLLYLGMTSDYSTSYIVKFDVPYDAPSPSHFSYRIEIIGRAVGTLPQLTISYDKASRPSFDAYTGQNAPVPGNNAIPDTIGSVITNPTIQDAGTAYMNTKGVITLANTAVEATDMLRLGVVPNLAPSHGFSVNPGDIIYIKVERFPATGSDGYPAELGIVQQKGLLNFPVST
jgi:hypothetical protein